MIWTLFSARRRRSAASTWLGAFAASRRGATALEFGLVATPFLFMIFAIIELALVFLVNVSLENATANAARQLRTGGIVATGVGTTTSSGVYQDVADFKTAMCASMGWIPTATCQKQLQVDVRSYTSYANQTQPNPITGTVFNASNLCFYSGNASSSSAATNTIVLLRAYYLWPLLTPFLYGGLQNVTQVTGGSNPIASGHMSALVAAEVFKNEPFPASNIGSSTC